jgi:hypothetical protein
MKSPYDIVSLILFAGVAILFLQRSASRERDPIAIWKYGVAAAGCAVGDIVGNAGLEIPAVAIFLAAVIFSLIILKPFARSPSA